MTQPKLNDFCKEVFEANKLKGFDVSKENMGQTIMLINSELVEAFQAYRKSKFADIKKFEIQKQNCPETLFGKDYPFKNSFEYNIKDSFEDEIADLFIYLMSLCGAFDIDIDFHIKLKREYNALREYKHGKKY